MQIEGTHDRLTDLRILAERARAKRIEKARDGDVRQFCELVMINEETGQNIDMAPFHTEWHRLADEHDRLLIWSSIEHGKALCRKTPIPGPDGWLPMGELRIGDLVYNRFYSPCKVIGKSRIFTDHRMYRVVFSDGAVLVADADHRWLVGNYANDSLVVKTTQEIVDSKMIVSDWHVPVAGSLVSVNPFRSIERVASVPAQCISVDSEDNTYLAGELYTVTHNTQQMAVARTLWDLGRNPNLRNVICSSTKGQAKKISRAIKGYIEGSENLHTIFPDLLPGSPWGENDFTVQRKTHAKDPSVQCTGLHGNILGARIDRLVLDDILNYENTRTAHARKDVKDWVKSTLLGRLTKSAKVRNIGNAWHPNDILHEFAKMKSWKAFVYSALLEDETPRWPEAWSPERIEAKREELGPVEFARQLLCLARDDSSSTFKSAWVERCLALGDGRTMAKALSTIPAGYQVFTGVDLAVQKHSAADETCFFTIAIDPFEQRHVLEIDTERISGPEIVEKIKSVHRRFGSIVIVENNAAQDFILQFTRGSSAVPIRPFTTGANKADPSHGVQSIATEMYNGKWSIPSAENGDKLHPEIAAWVDEMLYFDPAGHTGDRLMASWFAREGARMSPVGKIEVKKKPNLMRR